MGCSMLAVVDSRSAYAATQLRRLPVWFEGWEQSLSRFRTDSELSQMNHHPGQPVQVSEWLWDVFQTALRAENVSQGLVTPTVLDALEAVGYDRSFDDFSTNTVTPVQLHPVARMDLKNVVIDPINRSITLPRGVRLDFGGTAKGWAAHQAMLRLSAYGPTLVDASGDIAISGPMRGDQPWSIGIANPFKPGENLALLSLKRGGVATSGRDYRSWRQGNLIRHHIIDPRTSEPAETDILTATVIAPDVMEAEMAAKVVFILGSIDGVAWLEKNPTYSAFLILENRETIQTPMTL